MSYNLKKFRYYQFVKIKKFYPYSLIVIFPSKLRILLISISSQLVCWIVVFSSTSLIVVQISIGPISISHFVINDEVLCRKVKKNIRIGLKFNGSIKIYIICEELSLTKLACKIILFYFFL